MERPDANTVQYYSYSILVCCLACVIEFCGESANAVSQMCFLARQKVAIEAASLFFFNTTFVLLAIYSPNLGSLSYAIGRLVYSATFVTLNFYFLLSRAKTEASQRLDFDLTLVSLLPQRISHKRLVDNFSLEYFNLIRLYYTQSVYKQILTEGERYLITAFSLLNFSESGIYDIINNLGSLIARFVFLPVEDASYIYFTNSLERGIDYKTQRERSGKRQELTPKSSFENLLKIVSLIGVLVLVFGQAYSQLLLQIYGGDRLGKNPISVNLLRLHCVYVYILAINGVTESFFNATMSTEELKAHNKSLIKFSALFLCLTFAFSKLFNIYGFLLANCANMLIRIGHSSRHIGRVFDGFEYSRENFVSSVNGYNVLKCFVPDLFVSLVLAGSFLVTFSSEYFLYENDKLRHLAVGVACFLSSLFVIYLREKDLKIFILKFLKKDAKVSGD